MEILKELAALEALKGELAFAGDPIIYERSCQAIDELRKTLLDELAKLPKIPELDPEMIDPRAFDEGGAILERLRQSASPEAASKIVDKLSVWLVDNDLETFGHTDPAAMKSSSPFDGLPIQFEDWAHDHIELPTTGSKPRPKTQKPPAPVAKHEHHHNVEDWSKESSASASTSSITPSSAPVADSWFDRTKHTAVESHSPGQRPAPGMKQLSESADWQAWLNASLSLSQQLSSLDPKQLAEESKRLAELAAALAQTTIDPEKTAEVTKRDSADDRPAKGGNWSSWVEGAG